MRLAIPKAPAFEAKALVIAADCTAFASKDFHEAFLGRGVPLIMGCPKLDGTEAFILKISELLKCHPCIEELWVPIMEVPCCRGLAYAAVRGAEAAERKDLLVRCFIVGDNGAIVEESF
jgi:hypothetical protein